MTNSDLDRLREALRARADLVQPTELRTRALHTARRLRVRRALTGAATVVAAVGVVAGLVSALPGQRGAAPAAGPSSSSSSSEAAPEYPGMGAATLSPKPVFGPLFYLEDPATTSGSTIRLVSWTPGQAKPTVVRTLPREAAGNANVSPDGHWVSWVTGDDGALHVADLRGDQGERVLRSSVDGELLEPVWARDSQHLLIKDLSNGVTGTIDARDGKFSPLRTNLDGARHAVWASDGSAIGFVTADGAVVIAKPDGTDQRRVPNLDKLTAGGRHIVGLQSLSVGAAWVSLFVSEPGPLTDTGRALLSNAFVNTGDGHEIGAVGSVGDYKPYQATFRPSVGFGNSSHVLRHVTGRRTVELLGGNGEYWGGFDEPAMVQDFMLLNA